MKRTLSLFIAVAALGMSALSFAQDGHARAGAPQDMRAARQEAVKRVFGKLGLTAAQKSKIEAAQKKRDTDMETVRTKAIQAGAGGRVDREALGKEFEKIGRAYDATLNSILTKEQQAKYQRLMREEAEALQAKMSKGG